MPLAIVTVACRVSTWHGKLAAAPWARHHARALKHKRTRLKKDAQHTDSTYPSRGALSIRDHSMASRRLYPTSLSGTTRRTHISRREPVHGWTHLLHQLYVREDK